MNISPIPQFVIVTIAVLILSLLYFFYPAGAGHLYPVCIFHRLTGLYCPGCGSQRAVSALLHGHLYTSTDYNLLLILSLPLVTYSAFVFTWNSFHRVKLRQRFVHSPGFIKGCLALVILFGILRNLPFYPFRWLAP